jgi:hypothetical protein
VETGRCARRPPTQRDSGERTTGVCLKDLDLFDGGGLKDLDLNESQHQPKTFAPGPLPPWRARKRDSDQGRWGWVNGDDHHGAQVEMSAAEKISLQDLYALALLC